MKEGITNNFDQYLRKGEEVLWYERPVKKSEEAIYSVFIICSIFTFIIGLLEIIPLYLLILTLWVILIVYLSVRHYFIENHISYGITTEKMILLRNLNIRKIPLKDILELKVNAENSLECWYLNQNKKVIKASFNQFNNARKPYNILMQQLQKSGKMVPLVERLKSFSKENDLSFSDSSKEESKKRYTIKGIKKDINFSIDINGIFPIEQISMNFECPYSPNFAFKINSENEKNQLNLFKKDIQLGTERVDNLFQFQSSEDDLFKQLIDSKNQKGLLQHMKQFNHIEISFGHVSLKKKKTFLAIKDNNEILDLHLLKTDEIIKEKRIMLSKTKQTTLSFNATLFKHADKHTKGIIEQIESSLNSNLELIECIISHSKEEKINTNIS